jgi:hypothetical protein
MKALEGWWARARAFGFFQTVHYTQNTAARSRHASLNAGQELEFHVLWHVAKESSQFVAFFRSNVHDFPVDFGVQYTTSSSVVTYPWIMSFSMYTNSSLSFLTPFELYISSN